MHLTVIKDFPDYHVYMHTLSITKDKFNQLSYEPLTLQNVFS